MSSDDFKNKRKLQCLVCGSSSTINLEGINVLEQHELYSPKDQVRQTSLNEAARSSGISYQMILCEDCKLEFATPTIAPSADWYDLAYQTLNLYPTSRWEFHFVLKKSKSNSTLLELGCGSGEFLKLCTTIKNLNSLGLDFSPEAVKACKKNGLNAQLLDLTQNNEDSAAIFDSITAFHVLEHLDDPLSFFTFAKRVAHSKTTLWVAVPSDLRPSRIFLEHDFLDQPPHHMTRWTIKSLSEIGVKGGWTLKELKYEPITFKTSCWWITTRMKIYKILIKRNGKHALPEKLLRSILLPFAMIARIVLYKKMTGFTMLASYNIDE